LLERIKLVQAIHTTGRYR